MIERSANGNDTTSPARRPVSRRVALGAGGAGLAAAIGAAGLAPLARAQDATPTVPLDANVGADQDGLSQEIIEAFKVLPGQKALKLWAPADAGRPEWSATLNPDSRLFIASAFKATALAECLRLSRRPEVF